AMPSLKEGLPLALMEGMSGHLPVIAADIPEMHDIVQQAGGILVKTSDVNELTNAFREYLSLNPKDLMAKGESVFQYLVKYHSIENYRKSYLELINKKLIIR
ncbi:glycosyltransferase, partial [Arcobacter sp.]|uniref:glycosyltransferase n=1 Tax=Arcobacter sp. TaxID=1872629 RepID=UPI003D116033